MTTQMVSFRSVRPSSSRKSIFALLLTRNKLVIGEQLIQNGYVKDSGMKLQSANQVNLLSSVSDATWWRKLT